MLLVVAAMTELWPRKTVKDMICLYNSYNLLLKSSVTSGFIELQVVLERIQSCIHASEKHCPESLLEFPFERVISFASLNFPSVPQLSLSKGRKKKKTLRKKKRLSLEVCWPCEINPHGFPCPATVRPWCLPSKMSPWKKLSKTK